MSNSSAEKPPYRLHEAVALVLRETPNGTATTRFVSDEVWGRSLYWHEDGGQATPEDVFRVAREFATAFAVVDDHTIRLRHPA